MTVTDAQMREAIAAHRVAFAKMERIENDLEATEDEIDRLELRLVALRAVRQELAADAFVARAEEGTANDIYGVLAREYYNL